MSIILSGQVQDRVRVLEKQEPFNPRRLGTSRGPGGLEGGIPELCDPKRQRGGPWPLSLCPDSASSTTSIDLSSSHRVELGVQGPCSHQASPPLGGLPCLPPCLIPQPLRFPDPVIDHTALSLVFYPYLPRRAGTGAVPHTAGRPSEVWSMNEPGLSCDHSPKPRGAVKGCL